MTPYAVPWLLGGLFMTAAWGLLLGPAFLVAASLLWGPREGWRLYAGVLKDAWRWDP